ncbi:SMI1/KNR4 family protein [Marinicella litoralis]|uniref:SMI1/KNR4 family protein SUKH-1 n=1 Tax=Marinicella litoralis TaxID=644220 RepID=A0A4R6XUV6_9GAMM|nr:SMI1/KNR4 family protein [Marinicella litoralis]TDR22309.1 SMI1/KNR4 family protein SUKH-1 [Marinicella litoralis]
MEQIEKLFKKEISQIDIDNERFSWFEKELGLIISEEVKFFWICCSSLKMENSECYISPLVDLDYYKETIEDLFFNFEELNQYVNESSIVEGVKPYVYNKKWIPFVSVDGIYNFLDFDSADTGNDGQIILTDMMGGDSRVLLVSKSLNELCGRINEEIEAGRITVTLNNNEMSIVSHSEDDDYNAFVAIGLWEDN